MNNYSSLLPDFEAGEIDANSFTHRDHVGFAYEMLSRYDFLEAVFRYSNSIKKIASKVGADDKFNTTITITFLSVIAERMKTGAYPKFASFLDHNEDLLSNSLLPKWYSKERLNSDLARSVFLMPDVKNA